MVMCSWGYLTDSGNEDSKGGNDDAIQTRQAHLAREGARGVMKKHLELDVQGKLIGSMKNVLCVDIKKYAKDLDPTTGCGWLATFRSKATVYDICTRVNIGSCSLHAFGTYYLSCTIIAVERPEEHVHVRLDMDMVSWTCSLDMVGRLKEHVYV